MTNSTPSNPTSNSDDNMADLAGLYALDALESPDREQFETYLRAHPEVMDEVRTFQDISVQLSDVTAEMPPASLRDRVLADISSTPQIAQVPQAREAAPAAPVASLAQHRAARSTKTWLLAAATVAVVVAGLGGYLIGSEPATDSVVASALARPGTKVVPLLSGDSQEAAGHIVISHETNEVVVVSAQLTQPEDGRAYELWRIDADGAHNAGLFTPDKSGKVEVSLTAELAGVTGYAITDEPAGGSDSPTTPVIMSATVA